MKNVVLLFSLSCCLYLASSATISDESDGVFRNPVESRRLRDVPFDVLQLIFEHSEIPHLLSAIESDYGVLEPAIWAFKHKYAQKIIVINGSSVENPTEAVEVEGDRVIVKDYETALAVLKHFGSSISKLEVNYKELKLLSKSEAVNQLINEKCSMKLTELHVICSSDEFRGLTAVFPNVVNVSFDQSNIKGDDLRLDHLFPKMRHLKLNHVTSQNTEYLHHHFEHLESFTADHCSLSGWFTDSKFAAMLRKNPQIKSINILRTSFETVKEISESLTELEYLELPGLMSGFFNNLIQKNISFSSVKKFKLSIYQAIHASPRFIPFQFNNQLEEMEFDWCRPETPRISNRWLEFIGRQTSLKRFKIIFNPFDPHTTITYLTDLNLPNLEIFAVEHVNLNVDELDRFIKAKEKWQKLQELHVISAQKSFLDAIQERSCDEWTIDKVEARENNVFDVVIKIMK